MFWMCFSLFFVLPVTWMTVRSLKFQRTAWTREQSRSGLNALSCWKFWEKVAMGRWDSLLYSLARKCEYTFSLSPHTCSWLSLHVSLKDVTWLEMWILKVGTIFSTCRLETETVNSCAELNNWVFDSLWELYVTLLYHIETFDSMLINKI